VAEVYRAAGGARPVNTYVPGSILQTARTDYTLLGGVADNVEIHMS
jgi:hypothetical protein